MKNVTVSKQFRPDITSHQYLIDAMAQKLNEDSVTTLSNTDIVKMCIERGYSAIFPDRPRPVAKRKRLDSFPF